MTLAPQRSRMTTASKAPLIVHGTPGELYQHWLERTGQAEPEDLSNVFRVQWGKQNEEFLLNWIERTTQREIDERQCFVPHPTLPDIGCTLDGYRPFDDAVVELKVLSPDARSTSVGNNLGFVDNYAPQVAVQMACRGAARGYLAVQQGNSAPQLFDVNIDDHYIATVLERLAAFQICVATMTPPAPPPPAPIPPEKWRSVDLDAAELSPAGDKSNWGHAMRPSLNLWRDTRDTHAMHEQVKKEIKVLLPDDVGRVTYGTITVRRSRNGAVTIAEET